jgi:alanine racemase
VASVFTHLVGTDNEIFDEFTHTQVKLFLQMCNALPTSNFLKHVLNSNGIIRFPEYHFDMVRLGIGMYGIVNNTNTKLESTGVFKTSVSQIRNLNAGETVSYNRSGKLTRDSIIATIPVGYADGINRKLGNGNWFMQINEKNVPTIGDICMDMCMLDITDVTAMVGDEVIIINGAKGVMEMADTLKTIPYEILTGIGQRVKRVYIKE